MEVRIPDKLYFKIGEVANLTSLRPSVLRFWETEFEALAPAKSRTGQRLYTQKELELVLELKRLLYVEKLTIEGARKRLKSRGCQKEPAVAESGFCTDDVKTIISDVKDQLQDIRNFLCKHDTNF
jgi:DNA-binding transcriptional MerR regulator